MKTLLLVVFSMLLIAPLFAETGWDAYDRGDYVKSLALFSDDAKKNPEKSDAIMGLFWTLHQLNYHDAALRSLQRADQAAAKERLQKTLKQPSMFDALKRLKFYGNIEPSVSSIRYQGNTLKESALSYDLWLEAVIVDKGYIQGNVGYSEIQTESVIPDLKQSEWRMAAGIFLKNVTLRGQGGYIELDTTPFGGPQQNTPSWLAGVGFEQSGNNTGLYADSFYMTSKYFETLHLSPGLRWKIAENVDLRSECQLGSYNPVSGESDFLYYLQQTIAWVPVRHSLLILGGGVGASRYGMRNANGVLFSLADQRVADAWLQCRYSRDDWSLGFGGGFGQYKNWIGNPYSSWSMTLSVSRVFGNYF